MTATRDLTCPAQWVAWWNAGDWAHLVPAMRLAVMSRIAVTAPLDADTMADIASWVTIRCWALPYVPDDPLAFVARLTRNRVYDHFKRSANKHHSGADMDELVHPASTNDPLHAMIRAEDVAALKAALHEMPDDLRRPLVLHYLHGRYTVEIAAQLGITDGAVKMRLVRARLLLRALLNVGPSASGRRFPRLVRRGKNPTRSQPGRTRRPRAAA